MADTDLAAWQVAASLVLVAVAVAVSAAQKLGLEWSILWASARALVQLLLVGVALGLVLEPGRPIILSWLWVVAMLVYAAGVVARRAPEVPGAFVVSVAAFAAASAVSFAVLFGLGIYPLEGRVLVPLAGMLVGNSMAATVLVGRRIVDAMSDHRLEVEARLALGLSSKAAARPFVRSSVRTALIPQIETTKTVGLIALPGAMTGLILAGVDPLDATKVQATIMFLVLGSVATTTAVVALGISRRLFTPDHRPVPLRRRGAS